MMIFSRSSVRGVFVRAFTILALVSCVAFMTGRGSAQQTFSGIWRTPAINDRFRSPGQTDLITAAYGSGIEVPIDRVASPQPVGSFPTFSGGFEDQTGGLSIVDPIAPGTQQSAWTIQNSVCSGTIASVGGRSGPHFLSAFSATDPCGVRSPTAADHTVLRSTTYTIQFYYRTKALQSTFNVQVHTDGTTGGPKTTSANLTNVSGAWTRGTAAITSNSAGSINPTYGLMALSYSGASSGSADFDDVVMYAGSADSTAPAAPSNPTVTTPTASTLNVAWTASADVDGGGYMVVRGTADPTTAPNSNGIYQVGNTVATGQTVAYIGTAASFTDSGLSPGTHYYYRVYTLDKAFNYSASVSANGTTLSPPTSLNYSLNPATYYVGTTIANNTPSSSGGAVVSYSVSPVLPAGLSLDASSGVISGTPTAVSASAGYVVTATNGGGSTQATVNITVIDNSAPTASFSALAGGQSTANPALSVTATDNVGVSAVNLFFSENGGAYGSTPCSGPAAGTAQNGTWTCTFTGTRTSPSAIAYYVIAQDAASNTTQFPTAPDLYTIGGAAVPQGTYQSISLFEGSSLAGDVVVTNLLDFRGVVSAGGNTLELGCAAVTNADAANFVIGNIKKDICTTGTFTFPTGTAANGYGLANGPDLSAPQPQPEYSPVSINVTTVNGASSLTVNTTDAFLPGLDTSAAVSRYWTLTESGDITTNLTFNYHAEDPKGDPNGYQVFRRKNGSDTAMGGVVNAAGNSITVNGVSDFSDWGIGTTLITTGSEVSISGRVVAASGNGVVGATITTSGTASGLRMQTITGPFGYFHIDGLDAGDTYVVTVRSKRFVFANPNRVVTLNDSIDDILFTADPLE